jgi:pimeloyl-ACP methyl ester carboxylesterase
MPDAELAVIPDAHHATPMEKPRAFNAVLSEFLARHN